MMMIARLTNRTTLGYALFALLAGMHTSSLHAANVYQTQLDNGLRIIVKSDHRAPVLTSQIWYQIGASDEPDGITGISHMLEHMMFKGTEKLAPGEFSKQVAKLGATENAFTSQDYTAYFQTVEKSHLRTMLTLEAERMGSLKLQDAELQQERQVVLEERLMRTEDNPNARLYERFNALAFDVSPYRRPVIGWQSDIEAYTLADLQVWYERWYAPNNATLVVVGDVRPEEVVALAKDTLGKLASRPHPDKPKRSSIVPVGEKRLVMQDERAKVPMLMMGYAVPSLLTAENKMDAYALAVLSELLDGGSSARLSKTLVRGQQLLTEASASYDLYARLPTQFMLSAVPADAVSLEQAERALQQTIAQLIAQGISQEELARVQAQIEANRVFEEDSLFFQAMKLGEAATIGLDLAELHAYPERIRAVTADQVIAAAKRWLVKENLSVAQLTPLSPK
jgi:zinc protease